MSLIYKVTNTLNGKNYIGFTSKKLKIRKYQHKQFALKKESELILHKAIRKYGWENFKWEVIYESWDDEHCLTIMEPFFILEYNSFGENGYNGDRGGKKGMLGLKRKPLTEEQKKNISIATKKNALKGKNHPMYGTKANKKFLESAKTSMLGKKHSEETKKKMSETAKNKIREHGSVMLGKKHSEETKKKIKLKSTCKWELYDVKTKQFLTINDLMEYSIINNIKYKTVHSWKYKIADGQQILKKVN